MTDSDQTKLVYEFLRSLIYEGPTKGHLCDCGCRKAMHGVLGCEACNKCARMYAHKPQETA
jgi:hypothetical protein